MLLWFQDQESKDFDIDGETMCQYQWKPFETNGVDADLQMTQWITVKMPIAGFTFNKKQADGGGSPNMMYTSANQLKRFNTAIYQWDYPDNGPYELWVDNFRLVKVK
jgi:hypothetical protein